MRARIYAKTFVVMYVCSFVFVFVCEIVILCAVCAAQCSTDVQVCLGVMIIIANVNVHKNENGKAMRRSDDDELQRWSCRLVVCVVWF